MNGISVKKSVPTPSTPFTEDTQSAITAAKTDEQYNKYIYNEYLSVYMNKSGERSDRDELREVMLAFMDKYRGPYAGPGKTRLHKLVFFGDVYSLHHYGGRLTDANFKAYNYGAFATDIQELLEEMLNTREVEAFQSRFSSHKQFRNTRPPELSEEKQQIIDEVWKETRSLSDHALERFTKESWLYENTPYDEQMDWDEYREVIGSASQWREIVRSLEEKNPVNDDAEHVAEILD